MKKCAGFIIYDATWKRLVRWIDADPSLWCADSGDKHRGPTLFRTKTEARKAIAATKKLTDYAWADNNYVIYEVNQ